MNRTEPEPMNEQQAVALANAIEIDVEHRHRYRATNIGEWPGGRGWYVDVVDHLSTPDRPNGREVRIGSLEQWNAIIAEPEPAQDWHERAIQLANMQRAEREAIWKAERQDQRTRRGEAFLHALERLGIDTQVAFEATRCEEDDDSTSWDDWPRLSAEIDGLLFRQVGRSGNGLSVARKCEACGRWAVVESGLDTNRQTVLLELGSALIEGSYQYSHECGNEEGDLNYRQLATTPPAAPFVPVDERIAAALESIAQILEERVVPGLRRHDPYVSPKGDEA